MGSVTAVTAIIIIIVVVIIILTFNFHNDSYVKISQELRNKYAIIMVGSYVMAAKSIVSYPVFLRFILLFCLRIGLPSNLFLWRLWNKAFCWSTCPSKRAVCPSQLIMLDLPTVWEDIEHVRQWSGSPVTASSCPLSAIRLICVTYLLSVLNSVHYVMLRVIRRWGTGKATMQI